jgi:acyl carrier protein
MNRETLVTKLTAIVADTLDRPAAEVGRFDSLVADLGAESIDFLDLQFRIESAFGLKLGEEELWKGAFDASDERFVRGGRLTAAALAELERRQPGFRWERFASGLGVADLPLLITVESIAAHLETRLQGAAAPTEEQSA